MHRTIFRNVALSRICKSTLIIHLVDTLFKVKLQYTYYNDISPRARWGYVFYQGHNGQSTWIKPWGVWTFSLWVFSYYTTLTPQELTNNKLCLLITSCRIPEHPGNSELYLWAAFKNKHTVQHNSSKSQTNDSYEPVLFSDSRTYSATSVTRFTNKWLILLLVHQKHTGQSDQFINKWRSWAGSI